MAYAYGQCGASWLDEPSLPEAEEKSSNWVGNGPLFVAIAAATGTLLTAIAATAGTFLTSVFVERSKNDASIAAERESSVAGVGSGYV
jgi:hypothetical protein